MSIIEKAERLKKELTDKWVVVVSGAPELKRFADLTGKVKTVNMTCRAIVEFDGPVDIGWYDIDTSFLKVVDAPKPKKVAEKHAPKAAAATAKPAAPAAAPKAGGSLLDKIRAAGAKPAAAAAIITQVKDYAGNLIVIEIFDGAFPDLNGQDIVIQKAGYFDIPVTTGQNIKFNGESCW